MIPDTAEEEKTRDWSVGAQTTSVFPCNVVDSPCLVASRSLYFFSFFAFVVSIRGATMEGETEMEAAVTGPFLLSCSLLSLPLSSIPYSFSFSYLLLSDVFFFLFSIHQFLFLIFLVIRLTFLSSLYHTFLVMSLISFLL